MKRGFEALFAGIFFFGGISLVAHGIDLLNHPAMLIWLGLWAMRLGTRIGPN